MKITDAKVFVCCPGRNFVTLKVYTDQGVHGLGDDISVNNFGIQEYMRHSKETDGVFPHAYSFQDGYLHPGDAPGFGVDFNEKLAERFPYEPAPLPVNRKLDGTMFNW